VIFNERHVSAGIGTGKETQGLPHARRSRRLVGGQGPTAERRRPRELTLAAAGARANVAAR
jgi:hypothetical protein